MNGFMSELLMYAVTNMLRLALASSAIQSLVGVWESYSKKLLLIHLGYIYFLKVLEEIEQDWKYLLEGQKKKNVRKIKNNTYLNFTESVMRVSVIRTDQIFGCPFQPEDGFEPDYHIHGLVLKRERKKANYLSLCSKAFFWGGGDIIDLWTASRESILSHPLRLAL